MSNELSPIDEIEMKKKVDIGDFEENLIKEQHPKIARMLRSFYESLTQVGFDSDQALDLVQSFGYTVYGCFLFKRT